MVSNDSSKRKRPADDQQGEVNPNEPEEDSANLDESGEDVDFDESEGAVDAVSVDGQRGLTI